MNRKIETISGFRKKIRVFFSEVIYAGLKYSLTFLFSIFIILIAYIISGAFIGGIKDENILQYIRQNIKKVETNYQIEKVNFRGLGDESILILAYEKLNNIGGGFEEKNQKTYPGMYVFSKADNQLNLTKLIYGDNYYKNELYFEILPSRGDEYFSTGAFDNMKFDLVNKLISGNQEILLFSITQDGFTFSNTIRFFGLLRYNFNSGKIGIQPLLPSINISEYLDPKDTEYIQSECSKNYTQNQYINCGEIFTINNFSTIRALLNSKEEMINLTFDSLIGGYWKIYISDDAKNIKNIISLNGYTGNDCNQCEQDLLVLSYELVKGEYEFQNVSFIRKNDKDFWKKLDIQFMDYKSWE